MSRLARMITVAVFCFGNPQSAIHNPQSQVVCLDPGHPSEVNSGKAIQNGTSEVHIAWVVAVKLKKLLEDKGVTIVMTKSKEDQLVKNKDRALIANKAGAALMVRLHCDNSADRGFALYYPDRTGTKYGVTGPAAGVRKRSKAAAETLHAGMSASLEGALKDGGVRGDSKTKIGGQQGALTGSIFAEVPVVTIEMVVLRNKQDAAFIRGEAGQQKMAAAIAAGIAQWVSAQKNYESAR